MKKHWFAIAITLTTATTALFVLFWLMRDISSGIFTPALAAPVEAGDAPIVTAVEPDEAPNDLDTPLVITGTGFTAQLSGTLVITQPTAYLGATALVDVTWVNSTTVSATVQWGLDPGVYTLTVVNPDTQSGILRDAFTVTQGIGAWNAGELYGGNIDQIAVNPLTATTLYAIANDVGLFRSRDGGENWSFKVASVFVGDLAIDPVSPNTVYRLGYPHSGGQLYRSDDESDTWIPLTTTFPITQTSGVDCHRGYQLYTHPGTVYAAACGSHGGESGLIASTNHGEWTSMMAGLTDTQVTALAFHPTDPLTMYLGTASGNVFISHNGGVSWNLASQPLGNVCQIAVSPFEPHEVWISTGWPSVSYPCGGLKSANEELTAWTPIAGMGYDFCGDSPILFAPETWGGVYSQTVFIDANKTIDGGASWQPFGPGDSAAIRAVHPSDPDMIYSGHSSSSSGVHRTTDGGMTWEIASQGLTGVFPWSMEVVPDQPDVVFAGSNVGAVFKGTGGGSAWQRLPVAYGGSRGGGIQVDPVTTTRVYAGAYGGVYTSDDGGDTWPTFVPIDPPEAYTDCNLSAGVLLAIPGQPGTLLAAVSHDLGSCSIPGHGSIYRSTDYGEHWSRVFPTQSQESNQFSDLAYDALTTTIVYAARYGDSMLKSTDGGATWEPIDESGAVLDQVLSIAVEPSSPYRVFVATETGFGRGIYFSEDHGLNWQQAAAPLVGINIEDILFASEQPAVLYAGTLQGLFRSTDGAQSWEQAAGALGQVEIHSLATVTATDRVILYAGTTGGYVESGAAQALGLANNDGTLVNAGVYRYTTRRTWQMYLPRVLRANIP